MNSDMIGGIVRAIFPSTIAYLVGKGILPTGDYAAVATGFIALLTAVWSVHTNKTGRMIR